MTPYQYCFNLRTPKRVIAPSTTFQLSLGVWLHCEGPAGSDRELAFLWRTSLGVLDEVGFYDGVVSIIHG